MNYSLFVSCPKGLEYLLLDELVALGLTSTKTSPQGVYGDASLVVLYQICLWSRIANRVQLILFSGYAANEQALNHLCREFHWQTVFGVDKTIAIEFHGLSAFIRNTMFGAQVVKDGIVDHFRSNHGTRPNVAKDKPQILLHAHLKNDYLTVSLDLNGYSLHQRGYRTKAGGAPLKENVAAALLMRAKWPSLVLQDYAFYDPFCGSGTLVIEAAMMAAHIAPGLLRQDQSLQYWAAHQDALWEKMRASALQEVKPVAVKLLGTDPDRKVIEIAKENAQAAGVASLVDFQVGSVDKARSFAAKGLVVSNPPYGERLADASKLVFVYQQLGQSLHEHFQNWQAYILTSNSMLAKAIGLRSQKQYSLNNGPIECKLYSFVLSEDNQLKTNSHVSFSEQAKMLCNRLEKNHQHLKKWAKRNAIECYRVYDADLPEYAFAIDVYQEHVVLQEYAPPSSIPEAVAKKRTMDVIQVVPHALGIAPQNLVLKERKQQKGKEQYQKLNKTENTMVVHEGNAQFKINLYDYLDTGLFLDHRIIRMHFATLAPNTKFLNCFCYTGSASVHAALSGAITTNVDLSNTYLNWAKDNFVLNQLNVRQHQFIAADCRQWLKTCKEAFDVIFLDPPSFSNSKKMVDTLDIQRDHVSLIRSAMRLLTPDGVLYFSSNLRQFKLDNALLSEFAVADISAQTIDQDFKRNSKIHCCYKLKQKSFADDNLSRL